MFCAQVLLAGLTLLSSFVVFGSSGSNSLQADEPRRTFYGADSSKGILAKVENGKIVWQTKIGPLHDLHLLANGNLLFQTDWQHVVEMEPETQKIVWTYDATKRSEGKPVEVHAFQRRTDGSTMVAESGTTRIVEVDRDGSILKQVPLKVRQTSAHSDTRLARALENGNYLVCHEHDGLVREYSPEGKTVWEFDVPLFDREPAPGHGPEAYGNQVFSAVRLPGGNTLIGTGNGHGILEVTPQKEIVWRVAQDDLEGIRLAWVTTLQVLPSGNIVVGNCHAGPENPQLVEIDREKNVVWKYRNFQDFGDAFTNSIVIAVDGAPLAQEELKLR
jgi:outer membrane protein assembly factor BamB